MRVERRTKRITLTGQLNITVVSVPQNRNLLSKQSLAICTCSAGLSQSIAVQPFSCVIVCRSSFALCTRYLMLVCLFQGQWILKKSKVSNLIISLSLINIHLHTAVSVFQSTCSCASAGRRLITSAAFE